MIKIENNIFNMRNRPGDHSEGDIVINSEGYPYCRTASTKNK